MDQASSLETVDNDSSFVEIAKRHLDSDPRVNFSVQDGSQFLKDRPREEYDLIFADIWPGKYWDLEVALVLLRPGGIYVIDDMLAQHSDPGTSLRNSKAFARAGYSLSPDGRSD